MFQNKTNAKGKIAKMPLSLNLELSWLSDLSLKHTYTHSISHRAPLWLWLWRHVAHVKLNWYFFFGIRIYFYSIQFLWRTSNDTSIIPRTQHQAAAYSAGWPTLSKCIYVIFSSLCIWMNLPCYRIWNKFVIFEWEMHIAHVTNSNWTEWMKIKLRMLVVDFLIE